MSVMIRGLIITAGLLTALMAPISAHAEAWGPEGERQDRLTADEARRETQNGAVLPARRIISSVRESYPDAILDDVELVMNGAQLRCPGGVAQGAMGPRYLVKIRTGGARRVDVVLNARTARIICER